MTKDEAWKQACLEIIARCVAPDMSANAMSLLDKAYSEATRPRNEVPGLSNSELERLGICQNQRINKQGYYFP